VFDLLDYYESCERLNISYNKNLGIRGWQACARFIKKVCMCCFCKFSLLDVSAWHFFTALYRLDLEKEKNTYVIFAAVDFCMFKLSGFLCQLSNICSYF